MHFHASCVQTAEWRSRALRFDDMCEAVVQMFNRLSNAPNRSIVYDLYNYICDIKSGVCLARAYVKTLGVNICCPQHTLNPPAFSCRDFSFQSGVTEDTLESVLTGDAACL